MQGLIGAVGGDKVGIKSRLCIAFDEPVASYDYLIKKLNKFDFSFAQLMKRRPMFPLLPHDLWCAVYRRS